MAYWRTKLKILCFLLIVVGITFRFYNLNWGAPYYFHPDERNMAFAVTQLSFPQQMNPHFFAYGSFPLYVIFFLALILSGFASCTPPLHACSVTFEQAIIVSRLISLVLSLLILPLLYLTGKELHGKTSGVIAVLLGTFSVGFIQFAHFGTTEMWLTFLALVLFYLVLRLITAPTKLHIVLLGIVLGLLVAVKVSSLVLACIPLPALWFSLRGRKHNSVPLKTLGFYLLILLISGLVFLVTNPFALSDFSSFRDSITYESSVALGTLPVFYTQEFIATIPGLFQLLHVYPFLLNPVLLLLSIPAIGWVLIRLLTKKSMPDLLLVGMFLVLFLSQAYLFVKWTRYMVPTLPFLYLILSGFFSALRERLKQHTMLSRGILGGILVISFIFSLSYFLTTYGSMDTRIAAALYAQKALPKEARIISEVYDLGITPFNDYFPSITLFNFYDLDAATEEANAVRLQELLQATDYIILPSQRLYKTRLRNSTTYPKGYAFYQSLQNQNNYQKIYETPCNLACMLTYLGNPLYSYEETASVFDRPTVMIYKKL